MKQKKTKHEFRSNTLPALITVGPVTLLMVLLIAVPLIYVAVMSFCSIDEFYNVTFQFTLQNYVRLANTDYLRIYAQSMGIALITTLICILVGYPFSYIIARTKSRKKKILYMLVIIPFWTNSLIRIYGWRNLLGTSGWLNGLLMKLHLVSEPVDLLYKQGTTILGMVYCLIPFMILPLYTAVSDKDTDRFLIRGFLRSGSPSCSNLFRGHTSTYIGGHFLRKPDGVYPLPWIFLCIGYSGWR